jgi:GNAT superfamily N-acetyltransferase
VSVDQELGVDTNLVDRPTLSGARIQPARPENVAGYLVRLGAVSDYSAHARAWEALESDGCKIGVAVLDQVTAICARAFVGVSPERRRLGIGTDLLSLLLDEAAALGSALLLGTHCAQTQAPRRLVGSMGLMAEWRVHQGLATIAISVPPLSPRPTEHTP